MYSRANTNGKGNQEEKIDRKTEILGESFLEKAGLATGPVRTGRV